MIADGKICRVHFVGIGGIGMSGIAEVLCKQGCSVTGSDLSQNENTRFLESLGVRVCQGHDRCNLEDAELVVVSSAVNNDNPEVLEAKARGIPVVPRARMLAELMKRRCGIAIAGSHGKTTTTSLLAAVLIEAGMDPTLIVGGRLNSIGTNARLGQGRYLLAEADESDGSFLLLCPTYVVITNIDPEHLDYFKSFKALQEAFVAFANQVPKDGLVVACLDHPGVQGIFPKIRGQKVTYGESRHADYQAIDIRFGGPEVSFEAVHLGERLGRVRLHMLGKHNVLNALAALALSDRLGIRFETVQAALESFQGVQRRLSLLGEAAGITVLDDYAHHPDEIKTTLDGAGRAWNRRLVVIFQPHRYTRTRDLAEKFHTAFDRADLLAIMDIYSAGERSIPGVTAKDLLEGVRRAGHLNAYYLPDQEQVLAWLERNTRFGDVVISMGAGNVWEVGKRFIDNLKAYRAGGD